MKYLIAILTLLCFLLLLGYCDLDNEVSDLKEEVRLQGKEIRASRAYIVLVDDKCDRIKAEVRDIVKPFTRVIPVRRGFLGLRDEETP